LTDVFVSYAEPDRPLAEELARRLEQLGLSVFDSTKIEPGGNWESTIEQAFRDARLVVVLCTENGAASQWVKTETQRAVRAWSDDRLFLVRLDDAPLPTGLGGLQAVEVATTGGSLSADDCDAIVTTISQKTTRAPALPSPVGAKSRRTWVTALMSGLVVLAAGSMVWLFMEGTPPPDRNLGTPAPGFEWSDTALAIALGAVAVLISFIVLIRQHLGKSRPGQIGTRHAEANSSPETRFPSKAVAKLDDIDLFVSYSRADGRSIDPLIEHIREHGLNIWIDTQHQDGDVRYAGQIVRAIRTCRSVLIMCSENAYRSDHVVREVYVSGDHKKPFIVVQLDDAEFPDDFQYFLSGFPRIRLEEVGPDQFADKVTALMPA